MKKSLFIIAATALVVGCASNEIKNDLANSQVPIGFTKVYIENSTNTKAIATGPYTNANFESIGNTFGVFGYKTTATQSNYLSFDDVKVEFKAGHTVSTNGYDAVNDWEYSPLVYWDKNATAYSFYAYAPYEADFTGTAALASNSANAFSISGFKQATTSNAAMIDLMTDLTTHSPYAGTIGQNDVAFGFKHILSNITVRMAVADALKSDYASNPVTIVSVTIGAVKMDGSYAYDTDAYKWTLAATPTTHTFSGTQTNGNVFGSNVLTSRTDGFTNVPGLENLLFVPQSVDAGYVIKIQYKIANETYDTEILLSEFKNSSNAALSAWVSGYKYTYDIVIGPTPILFDVTSVSDWTDGGQYIYVVE